MKVLERCKFITDWNTAVYRVPSSKSNLFARRRLTFYPGFALCPSTIYGRNWMGKQGISKVKSRSLANACCIWRLHIRIAASTLSRCSRENERDAIQSFLRYKKTSLLFGGRVVPVTRISSLDTSHGFVGRPQASIGQGPVYLATDHIEFLLISFGTAARLMADPNEVALGSDCRPQAAPIDTDCLGAEEVQWR